MTMNPNGNRHLCDECDFNGLDTLAVASVRHLDGNGDLEYTADLCEQCLTLPTDYRVDVNRHPYWL